MELYHEAYDRYRRRVNPSQLGKFAEKLEIFAESLKNYPYDPRVHRVNYFAVRKELAKYQLNKHFIIRLDMEATEGRFINILKFLEQ